MDYRKKILRTWIYWYSNAWLGHSRLFKFSLVVLLSLIWKKNTTFEFRLFQGPKNFKLLRKIFAAHLSIKNITFYFYKFFSKPHFLVWRNWNQLSSIWYLHLWQIIYYTFTCTSVFQITETKNILGSVILASGISEQTPQSSSYLPN